jgi:hypothetical protein
VKYDSGDDIKVGELSIGYSTPYTAVQMNYKAEYFLLLSSENFPVSL